MAEIFAGSLDDPRVRIREADVGELIRSGPSAFDAILLDVDNGPEGLTRESNNALYNLGGLRAARTALRPGGVLAVWSAQPDHFHATPAQRGLEVEESQSASERNRAPARHVIWIGKRTGQH